MMTDTKVVHTTNGIVNEVRTECQERVVLYVNRKPIQPRLRAKHYDMTNQYACHLIHLGCAFIL